jgi:hypothetical protein
LDNKIDGVVITFANITSAKKLEANLREKHKLLEKLSARRTSRLGAVSRAQVTKN